MTARFTIADAGRACRLIGIDIEAEPFELPQLLNGMNIELEHGTRAPELDVTSDDPVVTAKIAITHLRILPDYYVRLERMLAVGAAAWAVEGEPGLGIVSARRPRTPDRRQR